MANLTKDEWIARAAAELHPFGFDDTNSFAEELYKTYCGDDADIWGDDPEGAVVEDLSY